MSISSLIKAEAARHGLDPRLIAAIVLQESGGKRFAARYESGFYTRYLMAQTPSNIQGFWDAKRCSYETEVFLRSCSFGLMQMLGQVAREFGFKASFLTELIEPDVNLYWGCKIFKAYLDRKKGNVEQALLRWNGGGNPHYPEQVLTRQTSPEVTKLLEDE